MKKGRIVASALVLALTLTSVCTGQSEVDAAKKVSLKKTANVTVGKTIKLKVKNGKKKAKVTWKSSKSKIAKVTKKTTKGNVATGIKGIKAGKAKITAVYKLGKKKQTLKCTVTVKKADINNTTPAPNQGTPTAQTGTTASPTPNVTGGTTDAPTAKPTGTPRPTPTRSPRPTATPTPTPTPYLIMPYKVDLSDANLVMGENGGSAAYNKETKALESIMGNVSGFIVKNPVPENERKDEYKYVEITYVSVGVDENGEVDENANVDINAYLGEKGYELGKQDAAGWTGELKLNKYEIGQEVTVCFGAYDGLSDNAYIDAIKIFNFGDECLMSIKDITFYMDGKKSKPDDFVAYTLEEETEITIDGVASEDEGWSNAKEYDFTTKVAPSGGVNKTDSSGTVRFMHDKDNVYFFVDVKDSNIDKSADADFEQDGLEIMFDEDNCKKAGDTSGGANWIDNKDAMHFRFTGLDKDSEEKTGLVAAQHYCPGGSAAGQLRKDSVEIKYALTDKGYSIEVKIPFATEKAVGDKVGIDLIIQDCKGGARDNEIYLYNTEGAKTYWNNENADFGTLILGKKAEAEQKPEPEPEPEPQE